jgi:hypothetical protein
MAKRKLRNISIDGTDYLWGVRSTYELVDPSRAAYRRYDLFDAYARSERSSRLQIVLLVWDDGNSSTRPCIFLDGTGKNEVNIHTPKWAAILIRLALQSGWQPTAHARPLTIADGVELLSLPARFILQLRSD